MDTALSWAVELKITAGFSDMGAEQLCACNVPENIDLFSFIMDLIYIFWEHVV